MKPFVVLLIIITGLFVNAYAAPPIISTISPQETSEDISVRISFTITADADITSVVLSSSNEELIPNVNLLYESDGSHYTMVATPSFNAIGVATITISVTDADTNTVETAFLLTVTDIDDSMYYWNNYQAAAQILAANFRYPAGVAVDPNTNKIFVADTGNNRVLRFSSDDHITSEAIFGDTESYTMNNPMGIHVDTFGHLWVADKDNNRVLRFDHASSKSSHAPPNGVLGQGEFTNYTGTSINTMRTPSDVWIDPTGTLWVADSENHRILRFDHAASKPNGANADAVIGQPNYTSMTYGLSQSKMNTPRAIVINQGHLFVADFSNSRVLCYKNAASKSFLDPADMVLGQPDFETNKKQITATGMDLPSGLGIDSNGRLYVSEQSNNRVLIFDDAANKSNGDAANTVLGQAGFIYNTTGTSNQSLIAPYCLNYDPPNKHLWVPDLMNNRVMRFDLNLKKPPVIGHIDNPTITENTISDPITFTVTDDNYQSLTIAYAYSNSNLLTSTSFSFKGPQVTSLENAVTVLATPVDTCITLNLFPKFEQFGTSSVTITVTDPHGMQDTRIFTANVLEVNDPPTVSSIQNQTIDEDAQSAAIHFTVADIEGNRLHILVDASNKDLFPSNADNITLSNTDGGNTYMLTTDADTDILTLYLRSASDQSGTSTITITVNDGINDTHTAFHMTVTPQNDCPIITPIDNQIMLEDTISSAIALTVSDPDATGITIVVLSSNQHVIPSDANHITLSHAHGKSFSLTTNAGSVPLTLQLLPAMNQYGSSVITISVTDGVFSTSQSFTMTVESVNDPPLISPIANQLILEDTQMTGIPFSVTDIDSAPLHIEIETTNAHLIPSDPNHITLYNASGETGYTLLANSFDQITLSVMPSPDANGMAKITVRVTGGTSDATESFTLTVIPENDAPAISTIHNQSTLEETVSTIPFAVTDVDGDPLTITVSMENPILIPSDGHHITLQTIDNSHFYSLITHSGGETVILSILPALNQVGMSSISISVTDGQTYASTSFGLTVVNINDPPTLSMIAPQSTLEDTETGGIEFSVFDADADRLIIEVGSGNSELIPANADHITLSNGSNNNSYTLATHAGNTLSLTLMPSLNVFGNTVISITVTDGIAQSIRSFTLTVTPVNDAPIISPIAHQTLLEDHLSSPIAFYVADIESNPLTIDIQSTNEHLIATHRNHITLQNAVTGNSYTLATDPGPLTLTLFPNWNQTGISEIVINATDGMDVSSHSFQVTVTEINDLPTLSAIRDQTILEDTISDPISFTIADVDASLLTVNILSHNEMIVPSDAQHITLWNDNGGKDLTVTTQSKTDQLTLTVLPAANQTGSLSMTVYVFDGYSSVSKSFTVSILPVNDPPVIAVGDSFTAIEDMPDISIPFTATDLEDTACSLAITLISSKPKILPSQNLSWVCHANMYTITANSLQDQHGSLDITILAKDHQGLSHTKTVPLNLIPVNDPPYIKTPETIRVKRNMLTDVLGIVISDVDAASNPVTVSLTVNDGLLLMNQQMNTAFSITGNLTVINATLGTIAYSPANNALGFRAITITANDRGHSGDGGPQWTITEIPIDIHNENVGPVNYLPTMSMKEDECLHITPISVFDLDAESNPLWVTLSTTNGYLSLSDINGVTLVAGQYQSATRITLAGSQQHINLALEQLTLTCTSHFNGWVQLTMTTNDLGHSGDSYSPLSATNSVPITVFAVIDPPTHQIPLALTTTEDAAIAFTAAVLDPDGEDVIAVTLEVDTGTLQLNSGKGLSGYLSTASFLSFTGIKSDINHAMTGIIFKPPANVYGHYNLQITYNDQDFQPTVVTVPLTISGLNDPPTIDHLSDTMIINEDTSITLTTAVDDIEAGIHDIQVTLHTENGLLQLQEYAGLIVVPSETAKHLTITGSINAINNSLKAFHFIPTDNYYGETVVAIELNDLGHTPMPAESDHASISIVIKSVNDSPVFALNTNNISVDEDFSTPQVITINTNAPVFGESDALTYTLSPDPASITWAAITFHPEAGRITITSIANEHGTQTFVITADDGEPENNLFSHSFLLNIAPVNDPPVFTLSTNQLVLKEDFTSVHTVSLTPSVIPWDEPKSITYTINPQSLTWVNLSINSETGDITIAKVSNGHGDANIGVMADNGLITATQSLSIIIESINDVPQITSHTHFSITENTAIGTEVYTISAIDADTDSLTYAIISISPADAFGISPKTGNIWIKSDLDFEAIRSYSLIIAVSDPVTSVEQAITVTITDTNDAPIISNVPEETQVIFKEDVLHIPVMTVEDTDLGSLPLQLTLIAENGRVSLTDTGLTLESGNYSSTALSVSGTISAVNHALHHLTFMPAENYKGPASLFVQITDSAQSDMGKARSISTLIHIDVLNYNQSPVFTEYPGHTICDEDQRLTQTIVIFDEDARADEAIQFTLIAYNGSVTLSDSDQLSQVFYSSTIQSYTGTIAAINAALDGLIVIPSSEFSGTAGYTIYANDWGHSGVGGPKQAVPASITITYKAINDPPEIAYPPQVKGLEDADIPLTLTVSDVDAYTHAIHVQVTAINGLMTLANTTDLFFQDNDGMADASFSFTGTIDHINNAMKPMIFHPKADFVGDTPLTITVNDLGYSIPNGLGPAKTNTQSLTITVTNVNDAPEILSISLLSVDEDTFYSSTIMATDIDLDGVSFTAKALPSWLRLTDNGDNSASLQGIPENAHVGVNGPFMITVTDPNQLSATQSYTIVVHNTNDAPAFVSSPLTQATEDHVYNYTISVHDIDGDDLSIHGNVLSHWLQLTDHGNGTANLVGIPGNEQVGITNVAILTVSDGIAAPVKQAFLIVVENTNDPPEITSMPVLTAIEDTAYQYLLSAYDMDKDTITFIPTILPEWLSLNNTGGNKAIIYGRPLNDHVGISDPIIITARDPGHATATQSFTIKVLNTNDSPIFLSEPVTIATEDSLYQYTLNVQDVDIGASIRIYKSILSDWLTLDDHGDGTAVLSGTPCNEHVGIKNAAVINATDGIDKAIQQSFMITVANTNDSPEIISLPVLTATEDELYAYTVIAQDMDGDMLSFAAQGVPSWLTLLDHGNNTASFQGIPLNDNVGVSIAFTVTVNDPDNADFSQSFSITVTNTNDAPVFMSTPNTTAIEDSPYTDTVHVQDVDMGALISIQAMSLPLWLTLNDHGNGTATITGTPLNANVGMSDMIVLTARDGIASAVSQAFMITVINTNDTPVITSAAVLTATEDAPYIYKIMGDDMDGDRLSFVADMPSWLTIINYGNNTATLQGIPENNDVGLSTPLVVTARDPDNAFAKQEFTIQVINTNDAPVFIQFPKQQQLRTVFILIHSLFMILIWGILFT
ncbi:MAG: hypothetical protein OMM_01891 [Candidatus Magnetoglobus multicellularis str. Araruama]|uniref:Cadherin domain-containing protein n=1 Tax=Candidatus Magnetoglobus multicellularis str. Araruama TaxID=890399 RepID=A0A1V1PBZ3_9BACT|nr:MAG: hypothetical protein OMM_01891 [Candidatus Magnetoglobus multicellularis str. Araruama]